MECCSELAIAVQSNAIYAPTFEDKMLGGFVTFDVFQAILNAKLLWHMFTVITKCHSFFSIIVILWRIIPKWKSIRPIALLQ
jgi:hypothetical protein